MKQLIKSHHRYLLFILCFVLLIIATPLFVKAQTEQQQRYNRFQYHKFHWQVYHTKLFHVYFPRGADSIGAFLVRQLPDALEKIKKETLNSPEHAPNIIAYPSVSEQYESNTGSFETQQFTLPTFIYKGDRIVLAYKGDYTDLKDQLDEGIARDIWEEQFKEGNPADQAKGGSQIPEWFKEGAIRYFAHGWTIVAEDNLRRSFAHNHFSNWQQVIAYEPRLSGHAFCYFLADNYYKQAVMQLFFQLKKKKSLTRAIRLIAKKPLDSLYVQCFNFYRDRFGKEKDNEVVKQTNVIILPHKKGIITNILLSPDKQYIAYVAQLYNQRTVYIYDIKSTKTQKINTYQLPPWISDHSPDLYPIQQWHPDGKELFVTQPVKGKIAIKRYTINGGLLETDKLYGVDGVTSITPLSSREFLLSAYTKGQSDIVKYNENKGTYIPYTNDSYDDDNPTTDKEGAIVFESDRPKQLREKVWKIGVGYDPDTLWQGIYTIKDKQIQPIKTDTISYIKWGKPQLLTNGQILATYTGAGTEKFTLLNNTSLQTSSTPLSNYQPYQYVAKSNEIIFIDSIGKDSITITTEPIAQWLADNKSPLGETTSPWLEDYRKRQKEQAKEDSILAKAKSNSQTILDEVFTSKDAKKKAAHSKDSTEQSLAYNRKKIEPYVLQLQSAWFSALVNNDYFINRYQPYQNYQGQFKFPEIGGMAQGGFTDLFENHHFSIGYRIPATTEGSLLFINYLNTAGKIDWGLTYLRDVESLQPDNDSGWVDENGRQYPGNAKIKTHYYEVSLHNPIDYDISLGLQTAVRDDRTIFPATDKYSLDFEDIKSVWSITTLSAEINKLHPTLPYLFKGFYAKALLDAFKGFSQQESALIGSSIHLAYHQPLYKYITLVMQLHMGYSTGDKYVLYNLGGVDNNVTPRVDSNVHFSQSAPYAFQTLVTPFRGYYQNSLYGNQYSVINADVYFPIFQTLIPIQTPLPSINDLQLGLFSDAGNARETWNSTNPQNNKWLMAYGLSARTTLAGYPLRLDVAWPGIFSKQPVWYFSLNIR